MFDRDWKKQIPQAKDFHLAVKSDQVGTAKRREVEGHLTSYSFSCSNPQEMWTTYKNHMEDIYRRWQMEIYAGLPSKKKEIVGNIRYKNCLNSQIFWKNTWLCTLLMCFLYVCHQWSTRPDPQSQPPVTISLFSLEKLFFCKILKVGTDRLKDAYSENYDPKRPWVGLVVSSQFFRPAGGLPIS